MEEGVEGGRAVRDGGEGEVVLITYPIGCRSVAWWALPNFNQVPAVTWHSAATMRRENTAALILEVILHSVLMAVPRTKIKLGRMGWSPLQGIKRLTI